MTDPLDLSIRWSKQDDDLGETVLTIIIKTDTTHPDTYRLIKALNDADHDLTMFCTIIATMRSAGENDECTP